MTTVNKQLLALIYLTSACIYQHEILFLLYDNYAHVSEHLGKLLLVMNSAS